MRKYMNIMLILIILATNGIITGAADNNFPPNMPMKVDIKKMADMVKHVDYDKIRDEKQEDFERIVEDWTSGVGRVDYVYYGKLNATSKASRHSVPITTSTSSSCYAIFGKWSRTPVNYVINPTSSQGLSSGSITSSISAAAETWDSAVSKNLFGDAYGTNNNIHSGTYDGSNVIDFGPYGSANVIAVTSIWYNTWTKQIYEFDMRFNEAFTWGNAATNSNPTLMDIRDIATHELGHGVGLKDLYSSTCSQATMYGYASYRETKKSTLETGDINGIRQIYGS